MNLKNIFKQYLKTAINKNNSILNHFCFSLAQKKAPIGWGFFTNMNQTLIHNNYFIADCNDLTDLTHGCVSIALTDANA